MGLKDYGPVLVSIPGNDLQPIGTHSHRIRKGSGDDWENWLGEMWTSIAADAANRAQQNNDGNGNHAPGFFPDHEFGDLHFAHSVTIDRLEQSVRTAKHDMGRQQCICSARMALRAG